MIEWRYDVPIYLHQAPVDFRKSINGLSVADPDVNALILCVEQIVKEKI